MLALRDLRVLTMVVRIVLRLHAEAPPALTSLAAQRQSRKRAFRQVISSVERALLPSSSSKQSLY